MLQNQAMRIVRTIGQAFEVCHKLDQQSQLPVKNNDDPFGECSICMLLRMVEEI